MGIGTPPLWIGFLAAVAVLLVLDLGVFHRGNKAVPAREALIWSGVWIGLSLAFNGFVAWRFGADTGLDFLTAYLVEKSLSVDNLFVFLVVFAAFGVAPERQHRLLFWGIFGALALRAGLIFGGIALLERFAWLVYPMGLFLVFTGVKLFRDRHKDEQGKPGRVVQWLRSRHGASMLFALLAIELTDAVFALDSVPAVLAITEDPFIVFTSNICALLGLRSLFFALSGVMQRLHYLKHALSGVLVFVGLKMLTESFVHVPHLLSLGIIAAMLTLAAVASLRSRREVPRQLAQEGLGSEIANDPVRADGPQRLLGRDVPAWEEQHHLAGEAAKLVEEPRQPGIEQRDLEPAARRHARVIRDEHLVPRDLQRRAGELDGAPRPADQKDRRHRR
jgi:tellurite resistance protein TerC